ncbi:MAG TPA: hypothetical protein VG736_05900 [Vicinamibacterales bacterium]|jgi:hypothetical protein|nr:hypothetical protein [Vicinamibacterales bacterium]
MRLRTLSRSAAPVLLAGLLAAGCGNSATNPTPVLTTETISGTVAPKGTSSKTFDVNFALYNSDAGVTLTSLVLASDNATPFTGTVGVAFGIIKFDGSCGPDANYTDNAATVGKQLVARSVFIGGTGQQYCIQVFDAGTLTEPVNWTAQLQHY